MATDAEQKTNRRVVRFLSAIHFVPSVDPLTGNAVRTVRTALRGQEVDLVDSEERRLDDLGALLPKGSKPGDAESEREAILDLYRGMRGDTEALGRAYQRAGREIAVSSDVAGGIVDVSKDTEVPASGGKLADHIAENKLSVDDTVALAGDDPAKAKSVLEAERLASGGSPRKGVEDKLTKIIEG